MTPADAFRVLGLSDSASALAVREAYRRLAMSRHPDRGGTTEGFKELVDAYRVASADTHKRPCPACEGRGHVYFGQGFHRTKTVCQVCQGTGKAEARPE